MHRWAAHTLRDTPGRERYRVLQRNNRGCGARWKATGQYASAKKQIHSRLTPSVLHVLVIWVKELIDRWSDSTRWTAAYKNSYALCYSVTTVGLIQASVRGSGEKLGVALVDLSCSSCRSLRRPDREAAAAAVVSGRARVRVVGLAGGELQQRGASGPQRPEVQRVGGGHVFRCQ